MIFGYITPIAGALAFFVVGFLQGSADVSLQILFFHSYWLRHSILLGSIPGAIISAFSNDILGRKHSMMLLTTTAMLSQLFLFLSIESIACILIGVTYAIALSVIPIFVSETSSPQLRGPFIVLNIICMPIGTYFSKLVLNTETISVKLIALIGFLLIVPICILVALLNESPYFLIKKNKDENCKQVLRKLHQKENINEEYNDIKECWSESHQGKTNFKGLYISLGVLSVQQFTGYTLAYINISTVISTHLNYISLWHHFRELQLILIGAGILSIFAVYYFGGKRLFKYAAQGAFLGNFLMALGFFIEEKFSINDTLGPLEFVGSFIYLAVIGFGLLHLPYVLSVELLPINVKAKCVSLLIAVATIESFIVEEIFKVFINHATVYPMYIIMAVCSFLGVIFGIRFIPETRLKSLTEIQKELKQNLV